jgi:hypothetical protein
VDISRGNEAQAKPSMRCTLGRIDGTRLMNHGRSVGIMRMQLRATLVAGLVCLLVVSTGCARNTPKGASRTPERVSTKPLPRSKPLAQSTSGIYVGGENVYAFSSFSTWFGDRPAHVADYLTDHSWRAIYNVRLLATRWARSGAQLSLSVPMLPAFGANLARGATGAYDKYFAALAKNLVVGGADNTIIRLGWEMNGSWYPWSIQHGNAANFAAYWRKIVTTMRAIDPSLQFDWCVSAGSSWVNGVLLDPASAYPGNAYVNYIGADVYDRSWITNWRSETARWLSYLTQPYGLEWHRRFAAAHHKPVSFPEWGLWVPGQNQGGDDPAFVRDMYNWMRHSNLGYEVYFNSSVSALEHFPAAQHVYRRLFGAQLTQKDSLSKRT